MSGRQRSAEPNEIASALNPSTARGGSRWSRFPIRDMHAAISNGFQSKSPKCVHVLTLGPCQREVASAAAR
jgi:hypothetical protein